MRGAKSDAHEYCKECDTKFNMQIESCLSLMDLLIAHIYICTAAFKCSFYLTDEIKSCAFNYKIILIAPPNLVVQTACPFVVNYVCLPLASLILVEKVRFCFSEFDYSSFAPNMDTKDKHYFVKVGHQKCKDFNNWHQSNNFLIL